MPAPLILCDTDWAHSDKGFFIAWEEKWSRSSAVDFSFKEIKYVWYIHDGNTEIVLTVGLHQMMQYSYGI